MLAIYNVVGRSTLKASLLYLLRYPQRKQPSRATYLNVDKHLRQEGKIKQLLIKILIVQNVYNSITKLKILNNNKYLGARSFNKTFKKIII